MKKIAKILVVIQRSNGDVLLSSPLIKTLFLHFKHPQIDLLVNDDTLAIAKTLEHIDTIHTYSYSWRKHDWYERIKKEFSLVKKITKKYDLSINLTTSDRSIFYALVSSKYSISAVESNLKKSWWKKQFLTHTYTIDSSLHILQNTLKSLPLLEIKQNKIKFKVEAPLAERNNIVEHLKHKGIKKYLIFHPSAQYEYKIYPENLRNELLNRLNSLKIPIIVTGANSPIDLTIKASLPKREYIYDYIGETSLNEYIALSEMSLGYIGMDTLNMHIAAGQDKPIFAIFGPTLPQIWSPWSNEMQMCASENKPLQKYGKIRLFQADMPCVACGLAGCDDKHGKSDCLEHIDPEIIFTEVASWLKTLV